MLSRQAKRNWNLNADTMDFKEKKKKEKETTGFSIFLEKAKFPLSNGRYKMLIISHSREFEFILTENFSTYLRATFKILFAFYLETCRYLFIR